MIWGFRYLILLTFILIIGCTSQETRSDKVLVFSKTEGFRHASIPDGIAMIKRLGQEYGYEVDATEDASWFTEATLQAYKVVVFMSTTGDVLDDMQQLEFQRFIQAGGSYVGIHAAADTEYEWPWYGKMVGGYFESHPGNPNVRSATLHKTEHQHPSTDHLGDSWDRTDEWYSYKKFNMEVTPLLMLDESTYEGGTNGDYHPIALYHEYDGGRAFYTGGGHTKESFTEPDFVKHVAEGIRWAQGDATPVNYKLPTVMPDPSRFVKTELDNYFNEPIELELLPDGRLIFIERKGDIKMYDPQKKKTSTLAHVDVYIGQEDGLIGMALDPNYADNKRIYFFMSDPEAIGQTISRFTFDPDADEVLKDKVEIIRINTQRDECCHSGGSIEFDHQGYLWAGIGDNTNPFNSDGYSPSDETPGRQAWDAQRSSANTHDLRGKILRIKVNDDGTYDIPDGNLFPKDGSQGRPEIYIMGCRNPYRFSIDSETGYVYWGEVGPDAGEDKEGRGPRGHDEINQAKKPGFFGWPYFVGNNKAYHEYDFEQKASLAAHDPNAPINNSPNNTGSTVLPPAQPAMIYYPYAVSEEFPDLGSGGRNAMAGPVYHKEHYAQSPNRFPDYYDDKFFAYDWMRGWIMAVSFDDNGDMTHMERFAPQMKWNNLIDIVVSPEGDFYTLEYGSGWFTANDNAILSHVTYNPGNRRPAAQISIDNNAGKLPLQVTFDGSLSHDLDAEQLTYQWDFGDGNQATTAVATHTFTTMGIYNAVLTVTDPTGASSNASVKILAGNAPPEVEVVIEGNQDFYFPNKPLKYSVKASDEEDGIIDPAAIAVSIDYLDQGYDLTQIAQGHQALSELKTEHPGMAIIGDSDCVSCHKIDGPSIGPSYIDIARKYAKDNRAKTIQYLVSKIIAGGGGVWGETAMAAHPDLSPKHAAAIAQYILTLSEPKKELVSLPAEGAYTIKVPKNQSPGGNVLFMASYTDKGADDIEPLRAYKNIVLRHPNMSAAAFTEADKASKFTITPDMMPGLEKEMNVLIVNDGATVTYTDIDLTDITSITLQGNAPSQHMAGGTINLYLDHLEGKPLRTIEWKTTPAASDIKTYATALDNIQGKHNIIITGKSSVEGKPVASIINMTFKGG